MTEQSCCAVARKHGAYKCPICYKPLTGPGYFPFGVLSLTYAQAESAHNAGYISDELWTQFRAIWRYSAPRFSDLCADLPRVKLINAYLDTGMAADEFDRIDLTPRYAPQSTIVGTRGDFGEMAVTNTIFYPAGCHRPGPILKTWGAVELRTNAGSRWFGCLHAYINDQLRMVVIGTMKRDEVRMTWRPVPEKHQ